jgi:hypothetical protein
MKKLETLNLTRLNNLEFGQHAKTIYTNITDGDQSKTAIQDAVLLQYLDNLNLKTLAYDKAMMQIAKSDETAKITQADVLRDNAFVSIQRYLNVFEFSTNPEQALAYTSLSTLFNKYYGLQDWNYEKQSNGMDSLISDLQNDKYNASVASIGMTAFVASLQQSNDAFKALFKGRIQEKSGKEVFNVKELRSELKGAYEKLINYVLVMATAFEKEEFNQSLSTINTVRKYYSDMVAKRSSGGKAALKKVSPSVN